jgi:integrase
MKKKHGISLPIHQASGRYYKCIGKALGEDGQPKPKIWYFDPHDVAAAVTKIGELKTRWQALQEAGKGLWDEDPIYSAERSSVQQNAKQKPTGVITVSQGFQLFTDHLKRQCDGGQVKRSHYTSQVLRLAYVGKMQVDGKTFGDIPLPQVGRQQLEAVVLQLCNRPDVTRHHYKGAAERFAKAKEAVPVSKMSEAYAKAIKASLKTVMLWLVEERLWSLCSHWKDIWKKQIVVTDDELVNMIELQSDTAEVDHFSLDELVKLWAATDKTLKPDVWKCIILLSLNCGFANEECSSLKMLELKDQQGQWIIERYRGKTVKKAKKKAYGKWWLWDETADYILKASAYNPHLSSPEAAVTYNGPLITTDEGKALTDNNAIGQGWRRLTESAKVRPLSFKFMRKTAAHFVKIDLGYGKEVADMLLSHSEQGMIAAYAGRDWDTLHKATQAMRKLLQPMFGTKAAKAVKKPAAEKEQKLTPKQPKVKATHVNRMALVSMN